MGQRISGSRVTVSRSLVRLGLVRSGGRRARGMSGQVIVALSSRMLIKLLCQVTPV